MRTRAFLLVVAVAALSACAPMRAPRPEVPARLGPSISPATAARLGVTAEDQAMSHFLRGEVALQNGDDDVALAEFEAAARLDPEETRLRGRLASLYVKKGNLDAALSQAEYSARNAPSDVEAQMLLAGTFASSGRNDEAMQLVRW